ncbi:hypothetical protein EBB07_08760 [Paenibacillaceae bacterium]|nr:hypothetical protein EBB07_08760 [Paenibacillaceae bacterium]
MNWNSMASKLGFSMKWFIVFIITLSAITATIPQEMTAAGKSTTIDAAKIKKISRVALKLKDEKKTAYTLYIYAANETKSVLKEDYPWTHSKKGDITYSGTYRAALLKEGAKQAVVQSVPLNLASITLPQDWLYTIPARERGQPDLFILSEWGTSNWDLFQAMAVIDGKLQRLKFTNSDGTSLGYDWGASGGKKGMRSLSDMRLQTKQYDNSVGAYLFDTFKLNVAKRQLKRVEHRYLRSPDWPNSVTDKLPVTKLMAAAKAGKLPGDSARVGMTLNALVAAKGQPDKQSNGEWGAYYEYDEKVFVGFDDYLHILNKKSSVVELMFDVEAITGHLYDFNRLIELLGKPNRIVENEEDETTTYYYKAGKYAIGFICYGWDAVVTRGTVFYPHEELFSSK